VPDHDITLSGIGDYVAEAYWQALTSVPGSSGGSLTRSSAG